MISAIIGGVFTFILLILFIYVAYKTIITVNNAVVNKTTLSDILEWIVNRAWYNLQWIWYCLQCIRYYIIDRFMIGFLIKTHYPIFWTVFPYLVFAFIIYIFVEFLWDEVMVPILAPLKDIINILIRVWNMVAKVVRMLGLRLPRLSEIRGAFPSFWDVFSGLMYTAVWLPLKALLKGWFIR